MDVLYLVIGLLLACARAQPMQPLSEQTDEASEAPREPSAGTDTTVADVGTTTPLPPVNCTTARDAAGACVLRHSCDYGTTYIDRTLYARQDYVKTCKEDQVCCPLDSIVHASESSSQPPADRRDDDTTFDFDGDD